MILDHLEQIPVGSTDDPEVHRSGFQCPDGPDFLVLDDLEKLGLDIQRQFADFIQKKGSPVGKLDQAVLAFFGSAGEGAGGIAKKLGFKQGRRDRGHVDMDKVLILAQTALVNEFCQHILAGAGLPCQHDGDRGGGQTQGFAIDIEHLFVGNDDILADILVDLDIAQMGLQRQRLHGGPGDCLLEIHQLTVIGDAVDHKIDFLILVEDGNGCGQDIVGGAVADYLRLGLAGPQHCVNDIAFCRQGHILSLGYLPDIPAKIGPDVKLGQLAVVAVAPDNDPFVIGDDDTDVQFIVNTGYIPHTNVGGFTAHIKSPLFCPDSRKGSNVEKSQ